VLCDPQDQCHECAEEAATCAAAGKVAHVNITLTVSGDNLA
jgi:hypothetical protein